MKNKTIKETIIIITFIIVVLGFMVSWFMLFNDSS